MINMFRERPYRHQEIRDACKHLENIFGTNFFKKGIEYLKDSDAGGYGMGREYSAGGASKLLLTWHKACEELVYSEIQGFFRPGLNSALIGALSSDLSAVEGSPGLEAAVMGLSTGAFDLWTFTMGVAAGFKRLAGGIVFSGQPGSFIVKSNKSCVHCFSAETFSPVSTRLNPQETLGAGMLLELQQRTIDSSAPPGTRFYYYDISALAVPLEFAAKNLSDIDGLFRPETGAIVLCKTHFPSLAAGVCRRLSCSAVVNKKTPGRHEAEGPLFYLPK